MENIAVVSLANEHGRRKHIDSLFKKHNLNYRYFDAINKSRINNTLERYGLSFNAGKISLGEVACYLSHYCLWLQAIEQDMPYLIVFEDDIYLAKNAPTLLNELNWLPSDFDVIKLETMYSRVMVNPGVNLASGFKLCNMRSLHLGSAGYIISNKGSKKLVAMTQYFGISRPVDHTIFGKIIEQKNLIYQISPALCIQDRIYNKGFDSFKSSLEETRQTAVKSKPSNLQKIHRELLRFCKQLLPRSIYRTINHIMYGYRKKRIKF